VLDDLDHLVSATYDERFVTARHVLSEMWRVGLTEASARGALVDKLAERSANATSERNAALVRYDIVCCLRGLFAETADSKVQQSAAALIAGEIEPSTAAKMRRAWRMA
jgi:hypothetical protein